VGCSSSSSSSTGGSTNTEPISLPSTLGDFKDIVDVAKTSGSGSSADTQSKMQDATRTATEEAYKKAYDGAAVAYRAYSDAGRERTPWVIAVRAKSPGLVLGPVSDPKLLQLANLPREVVDVGQAQCEVTWSPITPAGQTPPPESEIATVCQRTGNDLTVFVGGNGFTGPDSPRALADVADAAWAAVS
jgi:hypothetical protein